MSAKVIEILEREVTRLEVENEANAREAARAHEENRKLKIRVAELEAAAKAAKKSDAPAAKRGRKPKAERSADPWELTPNGAPTSPASGQTSNGATAHE